MFGAKFDILLLNLKKFLRLVVQVKTAPSQKMAAVLDSTCGEAHGGKIRLDFCSRRCFASRRGRHRADKTDAACFHGDTDVCSKRAVCFQMRFPSVLGEESFGKPFDRKRLSSNHPHKKRFCLSKSSEVGSID